MVSKKKRNEVYQTLIFDSDRYYNKTKVKNWISKKPEFVIMSSKGKNAIKKYQGAYRVRQKEPNKFKRSTFRTIKINENIKALVGVLK